MLHDVIYFAMASHAALARALHYTDITLSYPFGYLVLGAATFGYVKS